MSEYKVCIFGIEEVIDMRIEILEVYGDSTLVMCQIKGEWETCHPKLIPYWEHVMKLIPYFKKITFHHIPREENQIDDTLANLSFMFKVKWINEEPSIIIEHMDEPTHFLVVKAETGDKP